MLNRLGLCAVVLFAFAAYQVHSQACHLREIDLCVAIGLFQYQSNGVPEDDEKVTEWCETIQEMKDCMGNFTEKCMSPLQKEIMGLMSGGEDVAKQLCTPGSELRANYLVHSECLSEGADSEEFKSELKDVMVLIEKMFEVEFKKRFPLMCCGFRRFRQNTEKMTVRRCGEDSLEMINKMMQIITTDTPEIICQRYDPMSTECKALLPAPGTAPKGAESSSQIGKLLGTVINSF